jgi:hypothetical protein
MRTVVRATGPYRVLFHPWQHTPPVTNKPSRGRSEGLSSALACGVSTLADVGGEGERSWHTRAQQTA